MPSTALLGPAMVENGGHEQESPEQRYHAGKREILTITFGENVSLTTQLGIPPIQKTIIHRDHPANGTRVLHWRQPPTMLKLVDTDELIGSYLRARKLLSVCA